MLEPSTSAMEAKTQRTIADNVELAVSRMPALLQWRLLKASLVIHDISVIGLAFFLAYTIRFRSETVLDLCRFFRLR